MFPQNFKEASEVSYLLGHQHTLHHHIIYVDVNTLAQLWLKHRSEEHTSELQSLV